MYLLHFMRAGGFLGYLIFNDFERAEATSQLLKRLGYTTIIREKGKENV